MEIKKMKIQNGNIALEIGEKTIIFSGLNLFPETGQAGTIDKKGADLLEVIKYEEGIIELLLLGFEIKLRKMVSRLKCEKNFPALEIELFFKRLFLLLEEKPWIVTLIFNKNINTKYRAIKIVIFRMELFIKHYLSELMDKEKQKSISITIEGSNLLLDNLSLAIYEIRGNFYTKMTRYTG